MCIYLCIYLYVSLCVCVSVCLDCHTISCFDFMGTMGKEPTLLIFIRYILSFILPLTTLPCDV